MSLAWGSLTLLVFLLPGVLFLLGLYSLDRFTRDLSDLSTPLSAVVAVAISFLIHAFFYALLPLAPAPIPRISIECLISAVALPSLGPGERYGVSEHLEDIRLWVLAYTVITMTCGFIIGRGIGKQVAQGRFQLLTKFPWLYELGLGNQETVTYAYVLTNIQSGDRIVMYGGYLGSFKIGPDGRFSYLVLDLPSRLYLQLGGDVPRVAPQEDWKVIGEQQGFEASLFVEGSEIANVVFAPDYGVPPYRDFEVMDAGTGAAGSRPIDSTQPGES